nr:MAG TPA: hypothetical protein [Caudoviricetes sp.]
MPVKTFSTLDPQLSTFRSRGERGAPKPTHGGKLLMPVDAARWKSVAGHTLFPDRHEAHSLGRGSGHILYGHHAVKTH